MTIVFRDHFSDKSEDYNRYRPHYPDRLFSYLASVSDQHTRAWDCATGNGQSAVSLSEYFSKVIATDASQQQIDKAMNKRGISYRVATAEKSTIESNSIDLITVAQAFHWFNQDAFLTEVERVLKEKGVIAIWTYNLLSVNDEIDQIISNLYANTLNDYWFKERKMVENGYNEISLPFKELDSPTFSMSCSWNVSHLIGYLCTWSAVKKYQKAQGVNPVEEVHKQIIKAWGDINKSQQVIWPLSVRVWQK